MEATQPMIDASEKRQRDEALDRLAQARILLVKRAREVALALYAINPYVTSVMVLKYMEAEGADLSADTRWIGVVFRAGTGWRRVGWESTGSHGRPVAQWARHE